MAVDVAIAQCCGKGRASLLPCNHAHHFRVDSSVMAMQGTTSLLAILVGVQITLADTAASIAVEVL